MIIPQVDIGRQIREKWVEELLDEKGSWMDTLPETNIAPENRPSQKETSIPTIHFPVLC